MKTNSLLFLVSLAVLTSGASAATNQTETIVLPTYVVTSPRYLPVEQQINASLKEFSQKAGTPLCIVPELTMLKAHAARSNPLAGLALPPSAGRLAKS